MWYQLMSVLEDDESAQKKGLVTITYYVGCPSVDKKLLGALQHMHVIDDAVPLRTVGMHLCYDIPQLRPVALVTQRVIGRNNRLRFRAHYGAFYIKENDTTSVNGVWSKK